MVRPKVTQTVMCTFSVSAKRSTEWKQTSYLLHIVWRALYNGSASEKLPEINSVTFQNAVNFIKWLDFNGIDLYVTQAYIPL